MFIQRAWCMPNKNTFKIKPIKELILKYYNDSYLVIDPFANEATIGKFIKNYVSNDLDTQFKTNYNLEAQEFMKLFKDNSVDMLLFDPPYSGRQVSECYKKLGKTVTMKDTNSSYFTRFKEQIARIVKPKGIVITFGWNSNGIGKKYGFEIIEILLIAHGSAHNDTIVTVERKINSQEAV